MKYIQLSQGKRAIVDDDDYERLSISKWHTTHFGYATRDSYIGRVKRKIWMHREIMHTPTGFDTDHINGNRLDNRKVNLRIAARSQNNFNTDKNKRNTSGYKGVTWHKRAKKWNAQINAHGQHYYLGLFDTAEKAAIAYKLAAIKYHGEYARAQ